MEQNQVGLLLKEKDLKLHRKYFKEMVRLIGINVVYRAPRPSKHYTNYTEIESNYQPAEVIGCIFHEHADQKTMKKLGWVAELDEQATIISVPYDTHDLQRGALFIIPSGLDCTSGRLFRVDELSNIMIYPASITCKLVPEYENTYNSDSINYKHSNLNLLNDEEENCN